MVPHTYRPAGDMGGKPRTSTLLLHPSHNPRVPHSMRGLFAHWVGNHEPQHSSFIPATTLRCPIQCAASSRIGWETTNPSPHGCPILNTSFAFRVGKHNPPDPASTHPRSPKARDRWHSQRETTSPETGASPAHHQTRVLLVSAELRSRSLSSREAGSRAHTSRRTGIGRTQEERSDIRGECAG